jgi:hypothetical protein
MPTVLRRGPYRFFFYSGDLAEPEHVHVRRERHVAKVWLSPLRLEHSGGLDRREINAILRIIEEHYEALMEAWRDHFER